MTGRVRSLCGFTDGDSLPCPNTAPCPVHPDQSGRGTSPDPGREQARADLAQRWADKDANRAALVKRLAEEHQGCVLCSEDGRTPADHNLGDS